jgi:hypothetical protein
MNNKEYTDNDIEHMLKRVSSELSPNESAFSLLLKKLQTQSSSVSPIRVIPKKVVSSQVVRVKRSPYIPLLTLASSCMAIFVVYIGISSGPQNTVTQKTEVATVSETANTLATAENTVAPSVTQTEVSTFSMQRSAVADEVSELSSVLENELLAEAEADIHLFAISDSI